TSTMVENFEEVNAKQPIVRLLDTSRIEMVVDIPEKRISKILNVTNLSVRFDSFPNLNIPATLKEIGSEADSITRTFPVTLIMDHPENINILPGMAGRVSGSLSHNSEQNGFLIPMESLGQDSSHSAFVWRFNPSTSTLDKIDLTTAEILTDGVLVKGDLHPGDLVATAGIYVLTEDQKVARFEGGKH
ncbi:efflux RND transporter periplasmic adaptor subunit, partial [Pseudomonadota bacterium]